MPSTVPDANPPSPSASSHSSLLANRRVISNCRGGCGCGLLVSRDPIVRANAPIARDVFDRRHRERAPARLVVGADAAAIITVEVLVEQHEIAPVRIVRVAEIATMH